MYQVGRTFPMDFGGNDPYYPDVFPDFQHQKPAIFLYNISEQKFVVQSSLIKHLEIPGKSPREEYRFITSFPRKIISYRENISTGSLSPVITDGVRVVVDLIYPDNLTSDLDTKLNPRAVLSQGRNLAKRGVFYSLTNPPRKKDLAAAQRRLKAYCTEIWEKAITEYWSQGKAPGDGFGPEIAFAAKTLKISRIPWERRKSDRKKESR